MTADIDELGAVLEAVGIMDGCREAQGAVFICCYFFHEPARFNPIPSYHNIGTILNFDARRLWTHWGMFQRSGLEDGQAGRPPCVSSEHLGTFVAYKFAQFRARESATPTRLA
jgi:hypothetical protein